MATGPNIQSCSPGAEDANVCWAPPNQHYLYCGADPWKRTLRKLYVTPALVPVDPVIDPVPWGLDLADGNHCEIISSGAYAAGPDNTYPAYGCNKTPDLYVLAPADTQPVDRSQPIWTVSIGKIGPNPDSLPPPTIAAVAAAYFAG